MELFDVDELLDADEDEVLEVEELLDADEALEVEELLDDAPPAPLVDELLDVVPLADEDEVDVDVDDDEDDVEDDELPPASPKRVDEPQLTSNRIVIPAVRQPIIMLDARMAAPSQIRA